MGTLSSWSLVLISPGAPFLSSYLILALFQMVRSAQIDRGTASIAYIPNSAATGIGMPRATNRMPWNKGKPTHAAPASANVRRPRPTGPKLSGPARHREKTRGGDTTFSGRLGSMNFCGGGTGVRHRPHHSAPGLSAAPQLSQVAAEVSSVGPEFDMGNSLR